MKKIFKKAAFVGAMTCGVLALGSCPPMAYMS